MLTKDAIEHIEKNAAAGDVVQAADDAAVIMPDGYNIESLEQFQKKRNSFRAKFATHRIEDFAAYANAQGGQHPVFIDQDDMRAFTVFDMGDVDHPLHCKHKAGVTMKTTPEYQYLTGILNVAKSQQEMAEFIEDYNEILQCADSSGEPMDTRKAIAAIRRVTIERKDKQESEVQSYAQKKSAMEQVEAKSGDAQLPAFITMTTPLYYGLGQYAIRMRLSLLLRPEVMFKMRAINLDKVKECCAEEFGGRIGAQLKTDHIYIGNIDLR